MRISYVFISSTLILNKKNLEFKFPETIISNIRLSYENLNLIDL